MLCKSEREEIYFHSPFEVLRMTFNKNQKTHIILLPDIVKLCFVIIDIASSLLRIVDIDCRSTIEAVYSALPFLQPKF